MSENPNKIIQKMKLSAFLKRQFVFCVNSILGPPGTFTPILYIYLYLRSTTV